MADDTYARLLTDPACCSKYDFGGHLGIAALRSRVVSFGSPQPANVWIATAAYRTPTAEQLDVLGEFRHIVLLQSTVGSQFVALYYQLSPPIADVIGGNELLKTLVRELMVDPIVWVVEATGDMWHN